MRQGLIMTGLGIAAWGAATLFFTVFGEWLLVEPGDANFGSSLFLLELLTLLVLVGLALFVRLRLFPGPGTATRFGFIATAVGLLLDTFLIWFRDQVFPNFTEGEHHAFTIWMTLAYALMLIVPAAVDRLVKEKQPVPASGEEESVLADTDRTT